METKEVRAGCAHPLVATCSRKYLRKKYTSVQELRSTSMHPFKVRFGLVWLRYDLVNFGLVRLSLVWSMLE